LWKVGRAPQQQLLEAMQKLDQAQAKIADLEAQAIIADEQIIKLYDQLAVAASVLLSRPATATPPIGGHCKQALQPTKE
jgi:hypothetical protein